MAANDNTYNPRPVPPDFNAEFLDEELKAISNAMGETLALELRTRSAEPIRPREGMIVYADGAVWNPGSGEGPYIYINGAWAALINPPTPPYTPQSADLSTLAATAGTQVNFASIPQTHDDLLFEGFRLSHNNGAAQNLQVRFSTDNGGTFETGTSNVFDSAATLNTIVSTYPMFAATFVAARLAYIQLLVPRYASAAIRNITWTAFQTDGAGAGTAAQGFITLPANNIDYVRFQWSAGSFDDANGSIRLRGIKHG